MALRHPAAAGIIRAMRDGSNRTARPGVQQANERLRPGPVQRIRLYLREMRRLAAETHGLVSAARAETGAQLGALSAQLTQLQELAASQASRLEELASDQQKAHRQLVEILRFLHSRGQRRRAQLHQLRTDTAYERAFTESDPLVSVVIATYDNYELLRDRSIPSVLAQSYQNFEVIVVGDAAPDEAREVVEGFDDARISFFNLPYRGPYPDEPEVAWLASGILPSNEAARRARGLWIAPLDDDDAFRPGHLEQLLEHARGQRLELAYSRLDVHFASAASLVTIGRFPPELGQIGLQAAIYHAGLSHIFEYELADAAFGIPTDWAMCLRMMEAGVRIGMLDEVTVDYYPARSWTPRWEGDRYGLEPDRGADSAR